MKSNKLLLKDRLIISIDTSKKNEVVELCKKISGKVSTLKAGLESIYSMGTGIINTIKSFGYKVMLDSKLMDIPNTVSGAVAAITGYGVNAITVHTLGGSQMLVNARKTADRKAKLKGIKRPLFFGVTILTSLNDADINNLGFKGNYLESVLNLSEVALNSGMDGIICSPNEVRLIREKLGNDFYIATPGIRLSGDKTGDQKRINTPGSAISGGADFLIVGRSITAGKDVSAAIDIYLEEIERSPGVC